MHDEEESPEQKRLGERVRAARQAAGLTVKGLAQRSGLSTRFLSEVEAGRANPSLLSLRVLATSVEVDLLALLQRGPSTVAHAALLELVQSLDERRAEELLETLRKAPAMRRSKTIALLGLRGAGKSTVGPLLAAELGRSFLELDQLIEREAGLNLGALFELHGEGHVRQLESLVLRRLLDDSEPRVLATGGGLVTHQPAFQVLRERAFTVWLRATPQDHWDRVVAQGDLRPMANRERARTELEQLYRARAPLYEQADLIVDTSDITVDEVCARICSIIAV